MKLFLKLIFKGLYLFLTNKNQREFFKLVIKYGDIDRFKNQKIRFFKYQFLTPDSLSFIWQFKDIFVEENYKFNSSSPQPLIYDCGSNVGLSCLYFKTLFPNSVIKAFEADPNIAKILFRNIETNKLNNVEVINKAVWINDGYIDISLDGADGASIYSNGDKSRIESLKLSNLIAKEKNIDMLKMDIEGAEIEVIEDCKNSLENVNNLFIEYHAFMDHPQCLDKILEILRNNKFRFFIKQPLDRNTPFVNKFIKSNPQMDLQLNIFAYKND